MIFLPSNQLGKLIEEKKIEIAPLAFMRGRTLANAFVVLDEAQNATTMQMKMFLTEWVKDLEWQLLVIPVKLIYQEVAFWFG